MDAIRTRLGWTVFAELSLISYDCMLPIFVVCYVSAVMVHQTSHIRMIEARYDGAIVRNVA